MARKLGKYLSESTTNEDGDNMEKIPFWEETYRNSDINTFPTEPNGTILEFEHLLKKDSVILEAGCGEGQNGRYLAKKGYSDISNCLPPLNPLIIGLSGDRRVCSQRFTCRSGSVVRPTEPTSLLALLPEIGWLCWSVSVGFVTGSMGIVRKRTQKRT